MPKSINPDSVRCESDHADSRGSWRRKVAHADLLNGKSHIMLSDEHLELESAVHQFYGDRAAKLVDPFGHTWWSASCQEHLSKDEMKRWAAEMYEGQPAS